jgi:hypothetical protein
VILIFSSVKSFAATTANKEIRHPLGTGTRIAEPVNLPANAGMTRATAAFQNEFSQIGGYDTSDMGKIVAEL